MYEGKQEGRKETNMAYIDVATGRRWTDRTLQEACKGLEIETVKLDDLDMNMKRFPGARLTDMIHHCQRIMKCVTRIPIILGPDNKIYDGCHRVVKAVLEGKDELLCYRLVELPEHDSVVPGNWKRVG